MHSILERQNQLRHLRKLAAQRELYAQAKTVQGWQLLFVVVVATVLALVAIWQEWLAGYIALYSICIGLVDFLYFEPTIAERKKQGAQVQESFDCGVLDIDCSVFRAADVEVEDVLEQSDALLKIDTDAEKLRDWYSDHIQTLPLPLARLVCQRSNFRWDTALRRRYNSFLLTPVLSIIVVMVVASYLRNIDFEHFVLVVAAALPAVVYFLKQRQQNREALGRLERVSTHFRHVWQQANNPATTEAAVRKAARQIQDELYDHRVQSPLIPDLYYWLRRDQDEQTMDVAAEQYATGQEG